VFSKNNIKEKKNFKTHAGLSQSTDYKMR